LVVGLDEQVYVVVLDAQMDDPEVLAPRRGQRRLANRPVDTAAAQVTYGADRPQGDVNRIACMEKRPRLVRRAGADALRRTTSTSALATALPEQHQLLRLSTSRTTSHEEKIVIE